MLAGSDCDVINNITIIHSERNLYWNDPIAINQKEPFSEFTIFLNNSNSLFAASESQGILWKELKTEK